MSKGKVIRKWFLILFLIFHITNLLHAENCFTYDLVQYKASGCDTIRRTCCRTTKKWSDWGGSCPSCSSNQCWDGSKCADKEDVNRTCLGNIANAESGSQIRTAVCKTNSGWNYGSWSGVCICKTGYKWDNATSSCLSNYKIIIQKIGISGGCGYNNAPTSIEAAKEKSAEEAAWMRGQLEKKGQYGIPKEEDCTKNGYVSSIIADDSLYVDCGDGTYQYKYLRNDYKCTLR